MIFSLHSETVKNPETQYFQWFRGFLLHTLSYQKVPAVGLEPTRSCPRKILSLVRLPIPPHRLVDFISHQRILVYINIIKMSILFSPFSDFLYKSFDDIKAIKRREVILRRFRTTNHLVRTIFFQKYLS